MTPREFLTDWTVKYAKQNYANLDITYDDAYGFNDNRWGDKSKVKLSRLAKDLKEDFGLVEWFLLEVLWWDETIITKISENDNPVYLYNLDGALIKATPVNNPTEAFYREWVWEYYNHEGADDFVEWTNLFNNNSKEEIFELLKHCKFPL